MTMVGMDGARGFAPDSDLVADAANGDAGAFESLYRRHVPSAWQLAQAVAATGEDAAKATSDAFARVLRDVRRGRDEPREQFACQLLAAVYRRATAGPRVSGRPGASSPIDLGVPISPAQQVARAFRTLPSRWRAALWLVEIEHFDAVAAGLILGVSSAATLQLGKRARAGLEQRVTQAGGQLPLPTLAPALISAAAPIPPTLAARSQAKWRSRVATDRRWSSPAAGWLAERAVTPLRVCTVGLCAAGIIAAALVSQTDGVARIAPAGHLGAPAGQPAPAGPATPSLPPADSAPSGIDLGLPVPVPVPLPAAVAAGATSDTGTSGAATVVAAAVATAPAAAPAGARLAPGTVDAPVKPTPTVPAPTVPPPTVAPAVAAPAPVVQVSVSTGPVAVNAGVGQGSCTGVAVLGVRVGCTAPAGGISITVLGQPVLK